MSRIDKKHLRKNGQIGKRYKDEYDIDHLIKCRWENGIVIPKKYHDYIRRHPEKFKYMQEDDNDGRR